MSAFKDQLARDIDRIFLNTDEFAELSEVNGKSVPIVKDTHKLAELKAKSQYAEAIYTAQMLIYIKHEDLGYRPAIGGQITVDGMVYRVMQVSGERFYQLILEKVG